MWDKPDEHLRAWVTQIVSLSTTLNLETHFVRPWRNYRYLAGWTTPPTAVEDQHSRHLRRVQLEQDTHDAALIAGKDLEEENADFQKNMSQTMRDKLSLYGTRGFLGA